MEKSKKKNQISWMMEFAGQKRTFYVFSVLVALLGAGCQMAPFLLVGDVINKLIAGERSFKNYVLDIALMLVFWCVRVVCHAVSTSLSHKATFAVLGNIRKRGLHKLEKMPLGEIQSRGSGELKNILVERIDSIETTLAHILPEMTSSIVVVIVTVVYLFVLDWRMALASLITLPIGMLCMMGMFIGHEKNFSRTVRATKNLNDTAVEYIGGIEVIKVFGKAKSSYEKFIAVAKEGALSYIEWMRKCNIFFTFAYNIMPATLISVLPIGGILLKNGTLSTSTFIMVTILAMGLITPIMSVMAYQDDMAKLGTVMDEVDSIISAKEMPRPLKNEAEPVGEDIELKDVKFAYGEKEVLHGVSAKFQKGTVNALVGPSGGGKSTIAKLIASFFDVKEGSVSFGGVDIRKLASESYYKLVSYVSQDNFLFDETVRENIRFARLDATDEEVEEITKKCGCYDFIMGLEKGFDTVVGGGGSHLSGGEKQRICIARAMLKNAPIVILDEATAYSDPENEAIIQSSVAKLIKDKTLIVIAHRLSTVKDADQILVVNEGNIEARGRHDELLASSPLYRKLWEAHIASRDRVIGGIEK